MDHSNSKRSLKQFLRDSHKHSRRSTSQQMPFGRYTAKEAKGLSREEASWFISLPEKVRRQLFTKEEQILVRAACDLALLDLQDEKYWSYDAALATPSVVDREVAIEEDNERHRPHTPTLELSRFDDRSSVSSPQLPMHGFRYTDSVRSRGSLHSAWHTRARSQSSASKNFSLPFSCTPEPDQGKRKVATWLADTVSASGRDAPQGSKAQFYQDPETRTKLRHYLSTTEGFDEVLEFGFPIDDVGVDIGIIDPAEGSGSSSWMPNHERQNLERGGSKNLTYSRDEPNSPTTVESSQAGAVTPDLITAAPLTPVRVVHSSSSLRASERDMTIRMTLTRPELRSKDEDLYGDRHECQTPAEYEDPWALAPLPITDDVDGRQGAFAASKRDGKSLLHLFKGMRK